MLLIVAPLVLILLRLVFDNIIIHYGLIMHLIFFKSTNGALIISPAYMAGYNIANRKAMQVRTIQKE